MEGKRTITLAPGESLQRVFMLRDPAENALPFSRLVLGADSNADITVVVMPGVNCDISLTVDIEGQNAGCTVQGVYICPGSESVRIAVDMNHNVPHCTSRQLFKGLAGGTSRVDFYGKIIVAQDAQKTEAYQENHNLLLSDDAKVNTRPQLEIYADDVKCSHGATIGRLNEEEQFYMRSRGISLQDARVLQMISFVSPVFQHIPESAVKDEIVEEVERAIRNNF
ncbi:MAG: SufD family Fe-S cluster assembly protein [Bacteroidetes bacterium]|uniref:SufD family Fe-S cluster assembly protein n=1 Tax=Candidatus Cryptobacteroides merdavium TaxID=2840769 RepID=A0A9D9EEF9_9BACT|nr:SufD family Fe-S cluster assembly protein [Candidatus Cryptobacteroides merdavium]